MTRFAAAGCASPAYSMERTITGVFRVGGTKGFLNAYEGNDVSKSV